MRPSSEAVKADVRRRMGPPHRQSVAEISQELGIHVITLYKWRKAWRLQGEVVPATQKDPEGWGPADKFTVGLESAGINATELGRVLPRAGPVPRAGGPLAPGRPYLALASVPEALDANAQPLLTMSDQKDLQKRHQEDQREIKRLQQELRRKDKALAEAAALLLASKKIQAYWGEGGDD